MDTISTSQTPQTAPQQPPKKENVFKDIVLFALIAIIIIVPIRTFIAEPFIVSGASMDPTFASNQYLIVDQLTYDFSQPKRGDVIIFKYPKDPTTYFIKRIIGLPGETVSSNNGVITITNAADPQGSVLDEPYIEADHRSYDTWTTTLGPTDYFVMGDNRAQSSDSRAWGPLDRSFFVGRPLVRLYPLSVISVFPGRDTALEAIPTANPQTTAQSASQ